MLHKCANPTCLNPFRKLSEGRLFLVEMEVADATNRIRSRTGKRTPHRIEHFWLCNDCAAVLTLTFERGQGVVTVPLPETAKRSALAPLHLGDVFEDAPHPEAS
ncbi:MAG TPA: hypothetical protein VMB18_16920 [Terriglobales bacterium]|jgi:hypothetical protein|nr:hypothetical protein [Terriglobales bacterium]